MILEYNNNKIPRSMPKYSYTQLDGSLGLKDSAQSYTISVSNYKKCSGDVKSFSNFN